MGVARDLRQGGRQDGDEAALGKPRPLTLPLLPSKQQGEVRPVKDQEGAESEVFAEVRRVSRSAHRHDVFILFFKNISIL